MAEENKKKKRKKKKKHRFFWFMIKLQIVLMLVVLGCFGYYYFGGYAEEVQALQKEAVEIVAASDEKDFIPSQTSTIYDCEGNILTELKGDKSANYVAYEDIPANFVQAMISIEDKKFYKHPGIDYKAIFRAAKAMIMNGRITQGGSTITMQLAKLTYMEPGKTWQYKVEQMFLALELEKYYSKNKIMEFYLNNIYFANNYYGIEAACHGYFDCELNELDLSQTAFLCAIPNSPSYYDPVTNISHTIERRNLILKSMWDDGKITQEQYDAAVAEEIVLNRPKKANSEMHNYVDTYVYYCATRALMEQEGFEFKYYFDSEEEEQNYDEEYDQMYADCQKKMYSEGYKIYTSIDMTKQQELQDALDEELAGFEEKSDDGVYKMQGAAVCIDNETGFVVAIVGGRSQDFSTYTLNRGYQSHRQPGSSIKPLIVYTPSFERGYTPDTIVDDHKIEDGPTNSSGTYSGKVTVRTAVAKSLNTIAWQLFEELTPKVGLSYLQKMNFSKLVDEDITLASSLGGLTNGASPLEMASAFAALENDGVYRKPTCIQTIIDSEENIIYASEQTGDVVYEQNAARMMTDVMQTVMESGTGKTLKLSDMPCAGKTGTTNSQKDGWFVGYTRYYTTSVWVGYDLPKEVEGLTGSSYPGRIWKTFMTKIHEDLPKLDFLPYAQLSEQFKNQQDENQADEKQEKTDSDNDEPADGDGAEEPDQKPEDGDNAADEQQDPEDNETDTGEKAKKKKKNNSSENDNSDDGNGNDGNGNDANGDDVDSGNDPTNNDTDDEDADNDNTGNGADQPEDPDQADEPVQDNAGEMG